MIKRLRKKLKYLLGYKGIESVYSEINGWIHVVSVLDKPRLVVGDMLQSGGLVKKIWQKGIGKLKEERQKVESALIIGLGCGNCAGEIRKHYPRAKITGLEIDKQIISVAEKYFNLSSLKNLKVVVEDGSKYVAQKSRQKRPQQYDLIIIDVYLGKKIPRVFTSFKFYQQLEKLVNNNGIVVINQLFFKEHKQRAEKCIKQLEKIFHKIVLQRTVSNLLIFAKR